MGPFVTISGERQRRRIDSQQQFILMGLPFTGAVQCMAI